jgi:hypothetical protein
VSVRGRWCIVSLASRALGDKKKRWEVKQKKHIGKGRMRERERETMSGGRGERGKGERTSDRD